MSINIINSKETTQIDWSNDGGHPLDRVGDEETPNQQHSAIREGKHILTHVKEFAKKQRHFLFQKFLSKTKYSTNRKIIALRNKIAQMLRSFS